MAGGFVAPLTASIVSTPECLAASPPPRGTLSVAGGWKKRSAYTRLRKPVDCRAAATPRVQGMVGARIDDPRMECGRGSERAVRFSLLASAEPESRARR